MRCVNEVLYVKTTCHIHSKNDSTHDYAMKYSPRISKTCPAQCGAKMTTQSRVNHRQIRAIAVSQQNTQKDTLVFKRHSRRNSYRRDCCQHVKMQWLCIYIDPYMCYSRLLEIVHDSKQMTHKQQQGEKSMCVDGHQYHVLNTTIAEWTWMHAFHI